MNRKEADGVKDVKRLAAGLLAIFFITVALSGCSAVGLDVENKLRPPKGTGEQEAIQQALETYIRKYVDNSGSYLLKYPQSGEHRSAFLVDDFDGDGQQEAYAFYRPGLSDKENRKVHINYLRKVEDEWLSVADTEGYAGEIREVFLGDLRGNGMKELCVGWQQYGSRDQEMVVYNLSPAGLIQRDLGEYSSAMLADLTGSGSDSLLLLDAGAEHTVTARLWSMGNGQLSEWGMTRLDGDIVSFSNLQRVTLADGVFGVYVDGLQESGAMVTELIYWEDGQLNAPFYAPEDNLTAITWRESGIPSMDIDGDGQVEWPISSRMNGYEGESVQWVTRWMNWDYTTRTVQMKYSDLVNLEDRYSLRADEDFWQGVTAAYDKDGRLLTISTYEDGKAGEVVLELLTAAVAEKPAGYLPVSSSGNVVYYVRLGNAPGYELTMDRIRYMLILLP